MIKIENLHKSYGKEEALKGISFEINDGEVLGFLGPNGAGKSTTMKILTGFMPATSGNVKINGIDIHENIEAVQEMIGYLPETTPLYSEMLVSEYLFFAGQMRGMKKNKLDERVHYVTKLIGLEKNFNKPIANLSKGFKQRVAIAQAILHDPDILILDEPTVGLDPNQIIEIRELIKDIGKSKTVILCSHILSEVQATSDRVVIINNGNLVAQGTPKELIKSSSEKSGYISEIKKIENLETILKKIDFADFKYLKDIDSKWQEIKFIYKNEQFSGENLFNFFKDNKITIRELRKEQIDLEQIFTKLTK